MHLRDAICPKKGHGASVKKGQNIDEQLVLIRQIGKGGMGAKTLVALKETGAVYLNAIGGAAQFYARTIERVDGVSLLELGTPEAMWHLQVRDFPAIVTMDAHGASLHRDVETASAEQLAAMRA